jgi:hypothetical protein
MTVTQGNLTQEELEVKAAEKGITVEELQAEISAEGETDDEVKGILDKYGSDPKALAKALRGANQGVTKKIQEEIDKRKELEDENQRLRQGKVEEKGDPKDVRGMLRKKLKPVFNSETGEWETSDEALDTIGDISHRIARNMLKPVNERLAASEIRTQKSELKNLPHFKELESEMDKLLAKMPIEQRMQEGAVMAVYKYAVGEKTIADSQSKANQRPRIEGDINPNKPSANSTAAPIPKKLSPSQLSEFDENWKPKGFDEEDYLELLNRLIEGDKSKGFKVKRTLIDQTVSS